MMGEHNLWNYPFTRCIQLLILILVIGKGSALTANSSVSGTPWKTTVFNRLPLNDVLFTEDVLLEESTVSRTDCGKKCVETEGFVMCTFLSSPQGPPGHCRLHSQLQNLKKTWQNTTGAESFGRVLCGEGYMVSCGHCLRVVKDSVLYPAAQQQCQAMDQGWLVMLKTSADAACVELPRKNHSLGRIWVGADGMQDPGVYRWKEGTLLPHNSSLWDVGSPERINPESRCVAFFTGLFDVHCHPPFMPYAYICEKDFI